MRSLPSTHHFTTALTISLASLTLTGCMLGPAPKRPDNIAQNITSFINTPTTQTTSTTLQPSITPWWHSFGDPLTSQLVTEALANNTDLKIAAARILESQAAFTAATGSRLPQLGAGFTAMRAKNTLPFPATTTTYDLNLNVAWQIDLFGKLKRQQQSAWLNTLATKATRDAVAHTIVAQTIKLRTQIAALQHQLAIARSNTDNWQRNLKIITRRYNQGLASQLDLRQTREALFAAKAIEPQLALTLAQLHNSLDIILARQPGSGTPLPETLSDLPNLQPVPTGLPADLLDRRPDLRATELAAAAQTASIGIAIADLYPDLTLSSGIGLQSNKMDSLLDSDSFVWNIIASAAQKIFAGGALKANVQAAQARAQAAAAEYANAVLKALGEVEDAMLREKYNYQRYLQLTRLVDEAIAAEKLANQRYMRGVGPLLTVLFHERARSNAQMNLLTTQQELYNARVDLYLALGGDWKTQPEQTDNTPTVAANNQPIGTNHHE